MKSLTEWEKNFVKKNKLNIKPKFHLMSENADVIGLENTLRFILRVSAGHEDGKYYLRRVRIQHL